MTRIKPFASLRPRAELVRKVAALPYDVFTRKEAEDEIANYPLSILRIDRPETNFDESVSMYDDRVYAKADELLQEMVRRGELLKEDKPCYYIYELTMDGRTQTGIVGCVAVEEYTSGKIRRHENTREEKEQDRIRHIDATAAHTGLVFLAHRSNTTVKKIMEKTKESEEPLYDIRWHDGVRHRVFVVRDEKDIDNISFAYANIPDAYIADGHHRCAAAVEVARMRKEANPRWSGKEESNFFLAALFDEKDLSIQAYNRVVRDLNWLTPTKLLAAMEKNATLLR
ncbi:MAG: DUF1015 domain-containing protein, partial [Lachnospiraceae bacterium]|nr:DUF1015 domain-containing protein [Lachnospiraceae bacterium]